MAERGRPKVGLVLSDDERDTVSRWARRPKSAQALALRRRRRRLVLCVDKKTQVQALDRTARSCRCGSGLRERRTHDYVRGGTTSLYAALDIASGEVIADMTERHRALEFRCFLNLINRSVPEDLDVHVVVAFGARVDGAH